MKDFRVIHRTCVDCGGEFSISRAFQEFIELNSLKLPKRCGKCRADRKDNKITIICSDCGQEFEMTNNELKFYTERGLHEPKRCLICRKNKNGQRQTEKDQQV